MAVEVLVLAQIGLSSHQALRLRIAVAQEEVEGAADLLLA